VAGGVMDEATEKWIEPDVLAMARAASIMEAVIDGALRQKLGYACGADHYMNLQPVDIVMLITAALRKAGLEIKAADVEPCDDV
jgi:hypothetical protein